VEGAGRSPPAEVEKGLNTLLRKLARLPLLGESFSVAGRRVRVRTDAPDVLEHFRHRLPPTPVEASPSEPLSEVFALTDPQHTAACGLLELGEEEHPDREILCRVPPYPCLAAVSGPARWALLGATKPGLDRYWLTDFLAEVLPGVLLGNDVTVLHASAVSTPAGVVAFAGGAGSGKTTLALMCAEAHGWEVIADDKLLLVPGSDGRLRAHPLYMDVHFSAETSELIEALGRRMDVARKATDLSGGLVSSDPGDAQDYRVSLAEVCTGWRGEPVPLVAVVFPSLASGRISSRLAPLARRRAWDLLTAATLPFLCDHWPGIVERDRALLLGVLRQSRIGRLYVGSDRADVISRLALLPRMGTCT
jgi:hypothetical protein